MVVRYRGLECATRVLPLTLTPNWDETFHFNAPPGKDELDDTDEVELLVYDKDFGGLNDFIGYCKVRISQLQILDDCLPIQD